MAPSARTGDLEDGFVSRFHRHVRGGSWNAFYTAAGGSNATHISIWLRRSKYLTSTDGQKFAQAFDCATGRRHGHRLRRRDSLVERRVAGAFRSLKGSNSEH